MSQQSQVVQNLFSEDLYAIPPRVLVVLAKPWENLSADDITLLTKILSSVKIKLDSIQVVTRPSFTMTDVEAYTPSLILAFGASINTHSTLYEPITVQGTPLVLANELHQLDDPQKKALWLALRQIFGI